LNGDRGDDHQSQNVSRVHQDVPMTDPGPKTDDRHPADVVTGMVNHVLDLAATLAFHVAESAFYPDSVGRLAR
jgi:hypothetical protein